MTERHWRAMTSIWSGRFALMTTLAGSAAALMTATPLRAEPAFAAAVRADYAKTLAAIQDDLHRNPELSFEERRTAARVAAEFRKVGIEVTEGVGKTGVVGVLRNGEGPVILIRGDMDALPVEERSGLPNASHIRVKTPDGTEVPVSHACGHDIHTTALIGTARQLVALRDQWKGTVVFVAQPAEETLSGARAMLEDGLYTRFPKPSHAIAFHISSRLPTGQVSGATSIQAASSDQMEIVVHGRGGHGGSPHLASNPILIGAQIVTALQSIISQERPPLSPAVLSVGVFQSGQRGNVIPDDATIKLSVRANDPATRNRIIASVERMAKGIAAANGVEEANLPTVRLIEGTPATINNEELANRVNGVLRQTFGDAAVIPYRQQSMGSEDFAYYAAPETGVKGFYFHVGATPQADFDAAAAGGPPVPAHHSPLFKVEAKPGVINGTIALTAAALDLLDAR